MLKKVPLPALVHSLRSLLASNARSSTVYVSPTYRVTASYVKKPGSGHLGNTVAITFGKLNWAGRLLLAKCKNRGIPLPLNKPILRDWPKTTRKRRRKREARPQ